jgi:hypothetical protein
VARIFQTEVDDLSYSFDGTNDSLDGQFGTTYNLPLTMACWFKVAAGHPGVTDVLFSLNNDATDAEDSIQLRSGTSAANEWEVTVDGTATANAEVIKDVGTAWAPFVAVVTTTAGIDAYVSDQTDNIAYAGVLAGLSFISMGETTHSTADYVGLIAECAVWDRALTAPEIADFLAGVSPTLIAASNLVGYWPLSADGVLTNAGLDSAGDLTATAAVFNADHPTITTTTPSLFVIRSAIRFN